MKMTHAPKKDPNRHFTVSINLTKILSKGHVSHRGGGGQHASKNTKRNRTRSQQRQSALGEW